MSILRGNKQCRQTNHRQNTKNNCRITAVVSGQTPAAVWDNKIFIGINYKKPKAFGIYQDGDQFIVYKNKANGERAIRYQGTDEAYAVNELYLKLKSEILNQKANNQTRKQQQTLTREQKKEKRKTYSSLLRSFLPALWGWSPLPLSICLPKDSELPCSGPFFLQSDWQSQV